MERKLVKQGRNALTVTLPAKWLHGKGLHAGYSVFITEKSSELIISSTMTSAKQETTVDARAFDRSMTWHVVISKYIEGYDTITLLHNNAVLAQQIGRELLGMVIEQHSITKTVYKNIIAVPEQNFSSVLRRAAHILSQQAKTLELIAEKKAEVEQVRAEEVLLDYNILYCLRYLNKYEHDENSYRHFMLCLTFESAGDQITQIAYNIGKDKEAKEMAKKISKAVTEYVALLFSKDLNKLHVSLRAFRNAIGQKSFVDGLTYSLAETLYNFIGYAVDEKK